MMITSLHNITNAEAESGEGFSVVRFTCKETSYVVLHMPQKQAEAIAKAFRETKE